MSEDPFASANPKAIVVLPDGRKVIRCKRCKCKSRRSIPLGAQGAGDAQAQKLGTPSPADRKAKSSKPPFSPFGKKSLEPKQQTPKPSSPGGTTLESRRSPFPTHQNYDAIYGKRFKKAESSQKIGPKKKPYVFGKKADAAGGKDGGKDEKGGKGGKGGKGKGGKKGDKDKKVVIGPDGKPIPGGGGDDGKPAKPVVKYPPIEKPKKPWVPPDQRPKRAPKKKKQVEVPAPESKKPWVPPDQRPKPPKKPPYEAPKPPSKRQWVPPYKRKKHKKEKPKIEVPPFPKKKWIPPFLRPKKKLEPKYKKPDGISQKLDPSSLDKIWKEYRILDKYAVLNGHWSQYYKRYGHASNGYQGPCTAVVAIALSKLYKMEDWDPFLVDKVLDLGDQLYHHSMTFVEDAKCDPNIRLNEIFSSFYVNNIKITMTMKGDKYTGKLIKDFDETPCLADILKTFFAEKESGILSCQNKYFAIFKQAKGYYMLDPTDHNIDGLPWEGVIGRGMASVIKTLTTDKLAKMLVKNLCKEENPKFIITPCEILRQNKIDTEFPDCLQEPVVPPPKEKVPKIIEKTESFDEGFGDEAESAWTEIEDDEGEGQGPPPGEAGEGEEGAVVPKEEKKKPFPEEKPRAESVTYFLEIIPEKMGILRGMTHQGDPKFSKYNGTQSIANAVAAIAMLKMSKSKYWTPHIVNEILRTAEHIHHDTKKELKPDQDLTPGRVTNKITIDVDHLFSPIIDEIYVIGMLQSNKIELLDLLPALQEFFRNRDACIINGPLTVAAWQEDGVFYMFDPNERDKNGVVIVKEIQQGSQIKLVDFTPGFACVTWFKDPKDLVNMYMGNCPRNQRRDTFVLSNVEIKPYTEPYPDWNNFKAISESKWILRAEISQCNILFSKESRNTQCTAMAAMCLMYVKILPLNKWNTETMFKLLCDGDEYYKACIRGLKDFDKFVDPMLMVDELKRTYKLDGKVFKFDVEDCLVNGLINAKDTDEKVLNLHKGLKEFFVDNDFSIVTTRNISVAVFKEKGIYYYFDSHSRDAEGLLVSFGTACILRFLKLEDLVRTLEANLKPGASNLFNISRVDLDVWDENAEKSAIPLNKFKGLTPFSAILQANLNEMNEKFRTNAGRQTIPNLLMALGLSKLYEGSTWNQDWLDKLLDYGDKHYDECMAKLREGKLPINEDEGYYKQEEEALAAATLAPPPPPPAVTEARPKPGRGGGCGIKKLRGGGVGMKEYEEEMEQEITSLLCMKEVAKNANTCYAMQNLVKIYPQYVEKSLATEKPKAKKKKHNKDSKDLNYIEKNKSDIHRKSKSNCLQRKSEQIMDGSLNNLSQLIESGSINLDKKNKNMIKSYIRLCEQNPKVSTIFKSLSGVYPGMFYKTSQMSDLVQKCGGGVGELPIDFTAGECSKPTTANTQSTYNQNISVNLKPPHTQRYKGKITIPNIDKIRGGKDTFRFNDGGNDNLNDNERNFLMDFNAYTDIGPLRKMYSRKTDVQQMLEYRTRLAELLLQKSLYGKLFVRGGGADDEEEGNDFEIDEYNEDITSENVMAEFKIGVNKIKCKFETIAEGTFELDFAPTIRGFLNESVPEDDHRELLIESQLMCVAIWKDNDLFFVYDPRPRDESGHIYGWQEWPLPPDVFEEEEYGESLYEYENLDELGGGDTMVSQDNKIPTIVVEKEEDKESKDEVLPSMNDDNNNENQDKLVPPEKMGPEYWLEKEKAEGKACILWFTNTDDLVQYLMENTPPMERFKQFIARHIIVVNLPDVKDVYDPENSIKKHWYDGDWYNFKEIDGGVWILRGTMDQFNDLFPCNNKGKQTVANCFVALAYVYMFAIQRFQNKTINDILKYGDRLYSFTKKLRRKELLEDEKLGLKESQVNAVVDAEVYSIKEIFKNFCTGKYETKLTVDYEFLTGEINAQEYVNTFDVKRGLEEFFKSNTYGILCAKDLCVAVWKGQRMVYMFDPNARGPNGTKECNGVACITRFYEANNLANVFLNNLEKEGSNFFAIHRITMTKNPCPRIPKVEEEKKPDIISITGFQNTVPGKYILRGTLSADDPTFGRGSNEFPETIAVVALAMSLIHRSSNWSRPVIDEVLYHGNTLYAQTLDTLAYDFNPWEQKLELHMIPQDFNVGHVRVNICVRNNDQKGIIAIKNPTVPNLRVGLEKFFEENTHGVIETEFLTVAIWEDDFDHFIYMYDPNPRSNTGMPQPMGGCACALCFDSFKGASDHFVSLIPNEEKRQGEYTITPVDVIVGKKKAKKKKEKSRNKCTQEILEKKRKEEEARQKRIEKRNWNLGRREFYTIPPGDVAILRGTRCQASMVYRRETYDVQDIPNCIITFLMDRLLPVKQWTSDTIDTILDIGDQLYRDSFILYQPNDAKLGLDFVIRKIIIRDIMVQIQICKPVMLNQLLLPNLTEVLEVALARKPIWLVNANDYWVLVFQRDASFYLFDPHSLDLRGNTSNSRDGCAAVLQFPNVKMLAEKLFSNVYTSENGLFYICALGIKSFKKIAKCEC